MIRKIALAWAGLLLCASVSAQQSMNGSIIRSGTTPPAALQNVPPHQFLGNSTGSSAAAGYVRPHCADLSDGSPSCSTDATNAANISSGTLAVGRLPTILPSMQALPAPTPITGNYTINPSTDQGKFLQCNSSSLITITLPNNAPVGFFFYAQQLGTGGCTFVTASGATLTGPQVGIGYTSVGAQYGIVSLNVYANSGGVAAVWNLNGSQG